MTEPDIRKAVFFGFVEDARSRGAHFEEIRHAVGLSNRNRSAENDLKDIEFELGANVAVTSSRNLAFIPRITTEGISLDFRDRTVRPYAREAGEFLINLVEGQLAAQTHAYFDERCVRNKSYESPPDELIEAIFNHLEDNGISLVFDGRSGNRHSNPDYVQERADSYEYLGARAAFRSLVGMFVDGPNGFRPSGQNWADIGRYQQLRAIMEERRGAPFRSPSPVTPRGLTEAAP